MGVKEKRKGRIWYDARTKLDVFDYVRKNQLSYKQASKQLKERRNLHVSSTSIG